jgi:hypothetical protein
MQGQDEEEGMTRCRRGEDAGAGQGEVAGAGRGRGGGGGGGAPVLLGDIPSAFGDVASQSAWS